jgi:hypothetical protein
MNSSILNHDFLLKNEIIPRDKEPFRSLLEKGPGKQFSQFISTPVMSTIQYDKYHILVEEERYQIADHTGEALDHSPIVGITKMYFGKVLKYTPLKLGGINLNTNVTFVNKEDEKNFDARLGLNPEKAMDSLSIEKVQMGALLRYLFYDGTSEIQILKPKTEGNPAIVNLNFEYPFKEMGDFIGHLDNIKKIQLHFSGILERLKLEAIK